MGLPAGASAAGDRDRLRRSVLQALVVALAYVVFAQIGFTLAFATKQVTAVWPPTGIAVAALLLWGYRVWPGIWVAALISNLISGEPVWTAALVATGNTLAPVFGTYLLRRFGFDTALERVRDVFLLLVASIVAMTVSATNGVFALALAHIVPWNAFISVWPVWWSGDAMGVLFVAPPILAWVTSVRRGERSTGRGIELAIFSVTMLASGWISFLRESSLRLSIYPFVIWAALRFRQRETATAIAVVCAMAVWATAHDLGPWNKGVLDTRLIAMDTWMAVFAITALVLGAASAERQAAQRALQGILKQTMRTADTLQAAFLPERLPERAGLRCDALYMTAEHEALIGGDWYDAFELPDGRVVFSIGDVAGHGLEAAIAAGRIRQGIFATAFDADDPAEILTRVERILKAQQPTLATAIVAILSRDLSTMRYATAGHPPPIVASPKNPARSLEYGGLPFGAGAPVAATTYSVPLENDTVILFYTDGLTEFRRTIDATEKVVMAAVTQLVADARIEHPAAFVQRAAMGIERPPDDTVLVIARIEHVSVATPEGPDLTKSWAYSSNDAQAAHALRREIASFMRQFAPPQDELFRSELIVGELLANMFEHAPGHVRVDIDWTAARPVVTVHDSGPGLSGLPANLPADPFNENGRGLFIIASLAVDVQVESLSGKGTKMRIVLPIVR